MSDVFVSRTVVLEGGSADSPLSVSFYRPTRAPGGEYECTYEIHEGGKLLRRMAMRGEDGLQALLLALGVVNVELEVLEGRMAGRIAKGDFSDLRRLRPRARKKRAS